MFAGFVEIVSCRGRLGRVLQFGHGTEFRLVDFASLPEVVQQHGELAGDSDHSPLLAAFATLSCDAQAEATQATFATGVSEDVVSALDEQPAQYRIALLGDAHLRIALP